MIRTRLEAEKKVGKNHKELKLLSNLLVSSSEVTVELFTPLIFIVALKINTFILRIISR